jgi:hypothetical protein
MQPRAGGKLRSWVPQPLRNGLGLASSSNNSGKESSLIDRSDLRIIAQKLIRRYKLSNLKPDRLLRELSSLNRAGFVFATNPQHQGGSDAREQLPLKGVMRALMNQSKHDRIYCPLLTARQASEHHQEPSKEIPFSSVLRHLHLAACGEEPSGILFDPAHVREQLSHWRLTGDRGQSTLSVFASLNNPYLRLISPHPLYDNQHYLSQRRRLKLKPISAQTHPIIDYLQIPLLDASAHWIEPSP